MMCSHPIEFKKHHGQPSGHGKDLTKTDVMNTELSGQLKDAKKKLEQIKVQADDGNENLEIYRC